MDLLCQVTSVYLPKHSQEPPENRQIHHKYTIVNQHGGAFMQVSREHRPFAPMDDDCTTRS